MSTELIQAGAGLVVPAEKTATVDLLGLILTGLKPQSATAYRKDFRDFARFAGAPSPEAALEALVQLGQGDANAVGLAYRAHLEDRQLAPATIGRRLAALVRAVDRCRQVGLTQLVLEVDSPKAEKLRDTAGPGLKGWEALLAQAVEEAAGDEPAPIRDLAIVLLLHDRALRRGEASGLDHPTDLDLDKPAVQVLGKGRLQKEWFTISGRARDAVRRWIRVRGDEPGPLFIRLDPGRGDEPGRLTGESINRTIKALARRAGVARTVRAHGLRHQSITEALDRGWDVREVQRFSRHRTVETVLRYDDNRQDIGGQISQSLERPASRRRRGR